MNIRFLLSLFAFTLTLLGVQGQNKEFIHIQVGDYEVVDGLPLYTEQIALGHTAASAFDVQVVYPEYVPLTTSERALLKTMPAKSDDEGDYRLSQYLSISRKSHFLTVSFCPFVKRSGKWMRLSSCKLRVTPRFAKVAAHHAPSSTTRWANQSVLNTGKWVKIRVPREGIYSLSENTLKGLGFNRFDRVKIYGYGGLLQDETFDFSATSPSVPNTQTPDDLVEVPTLRHTNHLLFWAEGTTRWAYEPVSRRWTHTLNHYSRFSYYFITEGEQPLAVAELPSVPAQSSTTTAVPYGYALDDDAVGWYEGGRRMFDRYNFADGNSHTYRVVLPDFAADVDEGKVRGEIAFSASSALSNTIVDIKLNGNKVGGMNLGRYTSLIEIARAANASFSQRVTAPELNFDFTTTQGNAARLDYIRLSYMRRLAVTKQPYSFSPQSTEPVTLRFDKADSNTRLWRIGQAGDPTAQVSATMGSDGIQNFTTDTPQRRFVAFDASAAYPEPEVVGSIETQNLHADSDIDYVIIVPESNKLTAQAERLADVHRQREGMKVKVVRADQLYNEFSSGTPDANAYRRYLKMLYDRAATAEKAPKFLLLMGKSPWDNRLITEHWAKFKAEDFLLAYEVDHSQQSIGTVNSYVTDDFFTLLDDNEGRNIRLEKPDVAVGRMVVTNEAEAQRLVDKVLTYLDNKDAGAWKNTIAMLGDDGDANEHMDDAEGVADVLKTVGDNRFTLQKVYWDRYSRQSGATGFTYPMVTERLHQQMKAGAVMYNYSGHGSPFQISHERSLTTEDFKKAFSPHLSLWVLASCEIFPFDSHEENLAEPSLFLPNGGSIAFMCATRAVYASQNSALNRLFSQYVVGRDSKGRRITMGEALRLAKVNLVTSSTDPTINKLKYVYFGDPALALAIPTEQVVLDSIDGQALITGRHTQLKAGSVVRLSGHIAPHSRAEQVSTDFAGVVTTEIFDRAESITCKDNDGSAAKARKKPLVFQEQVRNIFRGTSLVTEGRFSISFVVPRDISYSNDDARISFYAVSNDRKVEGSGVYADIFLNGTSSDAIQDTLPPKVLAYLNNVDASEYAVVGSAPTFIAQISDDSGINATGTSLGHNMELTLDGKTNETVSLYNFFTYDLGSYQKGQVVYPLTGLSQGEHTLNFRVWDVNNNVTTTQLRFVVKNIEASGTFITATQNPASTDTHFIAHFPTTQDEATGITFEVYDTAGRKVWAATRTLPKSVGNYHLPWNLRTTEGAPLPDGIYLFRAVLKGSQGFTNIQTQKLIITQHH